MDLVWLRPTPVRIAAAVALAMVMPGVLYSHSICAFVSDDQTQCGWQHFPLFAGFAGVMSLQPMLRYYGAAEAATTLLGLAIHVGMAYVLVAGAALAWRGRGALRDPRVQRTLLQAGLAMALAMVMPGVLYSDYVCPTQGGPPRCGWQVMPLLSGFFGVLSLLSTLRFDGPAEAALVLVGLAFNLALAYLLVGAALGWRRRRRAARAEAAAQGPG